MTRTVEEQLRILNNYDKLPEKAYAFLPCDENEEAPVIAIIRGEMGYRPLDFRTGDPRAQWHPDDWNKFLGVTPSQAKAMLVGSMNGWDSAMADPGFWEQRGKRKPKARKAA